MMSYQQTVICHITVLCSNAHHHQNIFHHLLYSLFDDVNFPAYASEMASKKRFYRQTGQRNDLNNPHFQKLMNDASRVNKLQAFATYTLIVLYSVQMLATIFSSVWISNYDETSFKGTLFSIVMLCASIILTALRFIPFSLHKKYSDLSLVLEHSVLDEKNNTYSITYNHFQNCSESFNAIQRNRRLIITLFCIAAYFCRDIICVQQLPASGCSGQRIIWRGDAHRQHAV